VDSLIWNVYAGICHVFSYLKHRILSMKLDLILFYLYCSQWTCGLSCESSSARLLGLRVRFPQGASMSVCCGCCVLSVRGVCFGLFTLPEEFYLAWCVWMWSRSLLMRRSRLTRVCCSVWKKKNLWFVSKGFLLF